MKKVALSPKQIKWETGSMEEMKETLCGLDDLDTRVELIQSLIPLGLAAVADVLCQEVEALCGTRNSRKEADQPLRRWGRQAGSVYLGDQKVRVSVPRVRDVTTKREAPLSSYKKLQDPGVIEEQALSHLLRGLSCRSFEDCAQRVPQTFGLSASSVSRRFVQATAEKLAAFTDRKLDDLDLVALFIDGKSFGDEEMLICLGVTIDGRKIPLGFEQTVSENERVVSAFLHKLIDRGLCFDQGLLVVIDGAKGLYKAAKTVFSGHCLIQRCQWHKRENVLSHLSKTDQARYRRKLQDAYNLTSYEAAKAALTGLRVQLERLNLSAAESLDEGLEDTLTLHRLGLMPFLKDSFRTTNCIESVNSQVGQRTRNIKRWNNSNQRHRWLAAALLDLEPNLRLIKGYKHLPLLRQAIQAELKLVKQGMSA